MRTNKCTPITIDIFLVSLSRNKFCTDQTTTGLENKYVIECHWDDSLSDISQLQARGTRNSCGNTQAEIWLDKKK